MHNWPKKKTGSPPCAKSVSLTKRNLSQRELHKDSYKMNIGLLWLPNAWSAASASLTVSGLREGVGMP